VWFLGCLGKTDELQADSSTRAGAERVIKSTLDRLAGLHRSGSWGDVTFEGLEFGAGDVAFE